MVSQYLIGAETVLRRAGRPLTAKEIWDTGVQAGIFTDRLAGLTPWQTIKSKLSVHIRTKGDESEFVRTSAGKFYLRELVDADSTIGIYRAKPWLPPPTKERVVTFPTELLDRLGRFQGIKTKRVTEYLRSITESGELRDVPRSLAEEDESLKQMLVYVLVRRGRQLLAYRRGVHNYTDAMLRGSDCVGFGGHVDSEDRTLLSTDSAGIAEAAARELSEELLLPDADTLRLNRRQGLSVLGVLNDDSSVVGRRHFAVVLRYDVSDSDDWDRPARGEKSITQLRWLDEDSHLVRLEAFEYWSQLAMRSFAPKVFRASPSYRVVRKVNLRPPHLLVVVGEIGSGKTEAIRAIAGAHGYLAINSGQVLAKLMDVAPVPDTPRHVFQSRADAFINRRSGPAELAEGILQAARACQSPRVLVDGIRQPATLEEIRRRSDTRVGVLYVYTPPDVAFELFRQRESAGATIGDFLAVREAPVESRVREMFHGADGVLYNWYGMSDYRAVIDSLIADVAAVRRKNN